MGLLRSILGIIFEAGALVFRLANLSLIPFSSLLEYGEKQASKLADYIDP